MPENLVIAATDGFPLAATLFRPAPDVDRGAFVQIHPATAVTRGLYFKYARFLAERGFTALTFDYRGTGDSLPGGDLRGFDGRLRHWGERDLTAIVAWVTEQFPEHRHLAVAHSVGGQVLGLIDGVERFEAIWAVAAQWGSWVLWPSPRRWVNLALFYTAPLLTSVVGYFPGRFFGMGDLPASLGTDWMRWCRSRHYVHDDQGRPLRPYYDELRARVRWNGYTDDPLFGPPRAVAHLATMYPNAESEVVITDPATVGAESIGHFGFFRSRFADTLWAESADWFSRTRPGGREGPESPS